MSLLSAVGAFAKRVGTGTQSITGLGFQPKAIRFSGTLSNVPDGTVDTFYVSMSVGFDDGTTHTGQCFTEAPFVGVNSTNCAWSDDRSLLLLGASAINFLSAAGYIASMDADGFTINWDFSGALSDGIYWNYWAVGGSDVDAVVAFMTPRATPGSQSITGVGFQPKALITTFMPGVRGGTQFAHEGLLNVGFAVSNTQQAATASYCDATGTTVADMYQTTTNCVALARTSTVVLASFTSFDADGFTLNFSTSQSTSLYIAYLALGGAGITGAACGAFTAPLATGVQTVSIGIQASTLLVQSKCAASSGSVASPLSYLMGAATSGGDESAAWTAMRNGVAVPAEGTSLEDNTHAITIASTITDTINGRATISAWSASSIGVNWSVVDTERELVYLALGTSTPAAGSITVTKTTTPLPGGDTSFDFTTTGGLSPSTFSLINGESRIYTSVGAGTYGVTETPTQGWSTSYSVSDGSPHDAIALGAGEAVTVAVTNTFQSTANQLRRLRRWALPYDGNKKIFIPRIEIISQMGVGNADDADPVMSLRISPDGGQTWGPYRELPLGADGETMIRSYLTRFCQGLRNPVAELICDAPVFVAWIACELPQGFTVGTS